MLVLFKVESVHWYYLKLKQSFAQNKSLFPAMFFQNLFQCLCDVLLFLGYTIPHSSQLLPSILQKGQLAPQALLQLLSFVSAPCKVQLSTITGATTTCPESPDSGGVCNADKQGT